MSTPHDLPIPPALGIDVGRVLMCPADADGRPDTSFLDGSDARALATPAAPGVWEVVPALVRAFDGRVLIVSKAGPRIEALTRRWFAHHDFFGRTGIAPDAVRFCRKRPEKRDHALLAGLTHFIDDRADVLQHLRGAVPFLYLFGAQLAPAPAWTRPVADWAAVDAALLDGDELRGDALGQPHAVGRDDEAVAGRGQRRGGDRHDHRRAAAARDPGRADRVR
jgi:hypothetical protein